MASFQKAAEIVHKQALGRFSAEQEGPMSKIHGDLESEMFCASSSYRASLEAVRSRISFLGERDRLLITMYLDNKNTCSQISRLTGVSESTIARRISRIIKRLMNRHFSCAFEHREVLTKTQIGILQDYFIRGLSIRRLEEKYSLTYHGVRKTLRFLKSLRANRKINIYHLSDKGA